MVVFEETSHGASDEEVALEEHLALTLSHGRRGLQELLGHSREKQASLES